MHSSSEPSFIIEPAELEKLAELYDRFANCIDPYSEEADAAESYFEQYVNHLFSKCPPGIEFLAFKRAVVKRCKEFLRKNR